MFFRRVFALIMVIALWGGPGQGVFAQTLAQTLAQTDAVDRSATGGAQTLEDILARQRGERIDDAFRRDALGDENTGTAPSDQLGTLGARSNSDIYRAFRYNEADMVSSVQGELGTVVIQDGGMRWLELRAGPLPRYGGFALLGMTALILLFYLLRGKILIEGEKTGQTVLRFRLLERIAHWSMAIPFLLLALTGLTSLFGRVAIIPLIGKEAFSVIAIGSKFVHNYIAWVFIAGLILSFVLWAWKNLPDRYDIPWLLKGGGLFTKGVHPSSGKFNAGEKLIFWAVIGFGSLISLTGIALLFPYQLQMFTPLFEVLNNMGISQLLGLGELNTSLSPQEEMQYTQLWHAVTAFVLMTIIIAHIYLGSVGMEGALDSMTSGEVDVQWAREHHDKWYEEITSEPAPEQQEKAPT
jgi:formate dehydrogenase subunit gamma